MQPDAPVLFRETQTFRQWWIVAAVLIVTGIGWWAFLTQIVFAEPFGDDPASDTTIWIVFVLQGLVLPAAWWWLRLEAVVTHDVIRVRFPPFRPREVAVSDIVHAEKTGYRAVRDYGGYGYRRRLSGDVAFIVSGDRGVELRTRDSERTLLIGSQRTADLLDAIQQARDS